MNKNPRNQILVLGLGVSGKAAAAFLLKQGLSVAAVDKKAEEIRADPEVASLLAQGLRLSTDDSLDGIEQVILSPGIPPTHPIAQKALEKKIEVIGEVELAFRHIRNRCVGVTGSNGKTTTVLLTTHVLNHAGKKARALGNVGVGLSSYLLHPDPEEILVVELSSFQLETLAVRCLDLAMILNLTPNHLDRHASMSEYAAAKLSIQNCLRGDGKLLVSQKIAQEYGSVLNSHEIYDLSTSGVALAPISSMRYIQLGVPERQNIQAAFSIAKEFGVEEACFRRGLEGFRKPPHRIEWVGQFDGVTYYNDSKSSNIDSVIHAVNLFDGSIVLIAGGTDKGSSYRPWIECFRGKVKKIVAYGMAAAKMEADLGSAFAFTRVGPFEEAVRCAREAAKEKDTVLLSPGCSSYDQFRSFEHRGDEFKRIVIAMGKEWIGKKQS